LAIQLVRKYSEDRPQFPGSRSQWIDKLEFIRPDLYDGIPVYRVMDRKGKVIDPSQDPQVTRFIFQIGTTSVTIILISASTRNCLENVQNYDSAQHNG